MTGRTPNEGSPSDESLRVILTTIGVSVHDGVVPVPVVVNGEELFSRKLAPGEGDGYFGLRLLSNRTRIVGFRIERP